MALLRVPNQDERLTCKISASGVTFLKKNSYKKRYLGSKSAVVDINGNLYFSKKEFNEALKREEQEREKWRLWLNGPEKKRHKKTPAEKSAGETYMLTTEGIKIQNLSTTENQLQTSFPQKQRKKEYTINRREVRSRILAYIQTQSGKKELYFWTVTFPAKTPDDIAYQAFNTWLTTLRQNKILKNYIWVAERQDGKRKDSNGEPTNTIHFHLAIPHKMPVKKANAAMQTILKTFAKRGQINFHPKQCKRYNGVDIAKNRKTGRVVNFAIKKGAKALSNYLTKYVTKNDQKFSHLAWHNSRGYSSLFTGVAITEKELKQYFLPLVFFDKTLEGDFYKWHPWKGSPPATFVRHLAELNEILLQNQN
jgi:hypothetical protein